MYELLDKKWFQLLLMLLAILLVLGILPFWQVCTDGNCRKVNTWDKLLISTASIRADR